jgi:hypothetical protein
LLYFFAQHQCVAHNPRTHRISSRDGVATFCCVATFAVAMAAPVITHTMAASLFTQPSASKEELQHACSFIQSECNRHQRPYDMLAVVCGGLRPLYSGSSIEAELIASISALLSPPSSQDGTWNRLPSARYVPIAQEALFKCGGLDPIVASLSYPSAANKPAISRCAATSTARICSLIYCTGALRSQSDCNLPTFLVLWN